MTVDFGDVWSVVLAFYLSLNLVAALAGTVPGALVERGSCATLERFHFVLFLLGGLALLGYLYSEVLRATLAENVWKVNLGGAFAMGLYVGNVTARRLRNMGKSPLLSLFIWVPLVNVAFLGVLVLTPTARKKAPSTLADTP